MSKIKCEAGTCNRVLVKRLAAGAALLIGLLSAPLGAQQISACSSTASDADGDGWGWENNRSCRIEVATIQSPVTTGGICKGSNADPDGDGWGWENNNSCRVAAGITETLGASKKQAAADILAGGYPVCKSAFSDQDGDGFGWENDQSCRVGAVSAEKVIIIPQQSTSARQDPQFPACASQLSDTDGDGYGWENGASCVVITSKSTAPAPSANTNLGAAPPPVAAATAGQLNGHPVCITDSSDTGNTGFGYENNRTCVIANSLTATPDNPLLNQRSCIPWLEIGYGNYRLQNNTWNDGAVYSDNWSQCIELQGSAGNYVAKWDYNWLGRHQGDEYAVKSYPQVYYGRKTRYNVSGSVAETGLPVNINNMPQFMVDYDYAETGIVERNVALESFFHTSCDAEEYNKQFEMMIWVGVPSIRTPGVQLTSVSLSGEEWDVYTNPTLGWAYVAFVAKKPSNKGTLDWNAFVNWSRYEGPAYGVPAMGGNTCMGAIEIGSETFWGSGTFTLNRFQVRH
ncbi:hypothetical protein AB833_08580 [Chromatiales bacterium (ex Bugula neritina AB1)]|nr:hypothetical protein AB833_08580 [Chromatiales bacterium (ex Bugula neritina AB1)]